MFGVCAIFASLGTHAQTAEEITKSPKWTKAVVVTDGGSVYSKPDFDSPVVDYLPYNTKLWVTKKAVPGGGGLGFFHFVRYKSKSGYVVDTDLHITKKKGEKDSAATDAAVKKKDAEKAKAKEAEAEGDKEAVATKEAAQDKDKATEKPKTKPKTKGKKKNEDDSEGKESVYYKRYIGVGLALVNFTEKFSGQQYSDKITMYGLRMSGPGTLFDGPPLDFNVLYSMQSPKYYTYFADAAPKGFLLFSDLMAILPFYEWHNLMINYGVGIMATYTNYKVLVKNTLFDSQEVRVGVDFDLGVTEKVGKYAIKLDAKYYYEKTRYLGYTGSFQMEY